MGYEWPVNRDCYEEPLPVLGDTPTDEEQAAYDAAVARQSSAEDTAILVLWRLTGEQFGIRQVTIRPCPTAGWPRHPYVPLLFDRVWGHTSCGCVGSCEVSGPRVLHLPGPVVEIVQVRIDDQIIAPTGYTLEGDVLYRVCDSGCGWPSQNLARPMGEPGTWSVTYRQGIPVPPGGATMAGRLAREFMAACSGGKCELPSSLRQTTRRGVSHSFDPTSILEAGLTGITAIDHWINAINPNRLVRQAEVL